MFSRHTSNLGNKTARRKYAYFQQLRFMACSDIVFFLEQYKNLSCREKKQFIKWTLKFDRKRNNQ